MQELVVNAATFGAFPKVNALDLERARSWEDCRQVDGSMPLLLPSKARCAHRG